MAIQDTIIEALRASHEAHQAGLAALMASQTAHHAALEDIDALRMDKAALEARVAELEAQVAHLESESVKIVEPDTVNPLLDWLSRAVAATHSAIHPGSTPSESHASPAAAPSEQHPDMGVVADTSAAEVHAAEVHASDVRHSSEAPAADVEPMHEGHAPSEPTTASAETPMTLAAAPAVAEEPITEAHEPLVSTLLEEASAAAESHTEDDKHVFEHAAVAPAPHVVTEPDAPQGFASQIHAVVLHFEDAEIGKDMPDTLDAAVHAAETREHGAMEKQN